MSKETTYTWLALNRLLKHTTNERLALRIFEQQKALPVTRWESAEQRDRWLRRIWSRYARLRARRERKELVNK